MPFNRFGHAATIIAFVLAAWAWVTPAAAQATIQKVANKSLNGTAYARLRNLSYEQCEARCLRDPQCVAIEHFRGNSILRSHNCSLFSSFARTADAQNSDVGYKRQRPAVTDGSAARPVPRSATRNPTFGGGGGGGGSGGSAGGGSGRSDPSGGAGGGSGRTVDIAPSPTTEARSASSDQDRAEAVRRQAEFERRASEIQASRTAEAPATRSVRPSIPLESPSPSARRVEGPPAATRSARPAAAPPPPPPIVAPEARSASGAASAQDRFHIVPVFYGTDRNQVKQQSRIGYANDRAKRLEIGRALITVPLDHKVPNIERPRAWTIPYLGTVQLEREDPNRHFTVREVKVMTKTELLDLVRQRLGGSQTYKNQSLVFIHGYNTSFDEALFRTAQLTYDLQFDGASFTYSWPSGGGLASYIYDRDSAQGAERYLYEFLQMVQNETGSTNINIIAHSMGNQMLLQVLRSLRLRAPDAISKINQIILASPDVDRDAFEGIAAEISGVAKGITLYASARDRALEASRFVAGNKPRAGDVPLDGPVIVAGIDTIDITQVSTDYLALHHSGYAEHSDLLTDIGQIIRGGTRPWERRLKYYKPVKLQAGVYWRYEK